jgi:hypothetical protein
LKFLFRLDRMGKILNNLEGPVETDLLSLSLKYRNLQVSVVITLLNSGFCRNLEK